jgi:hypothetical protein
MDSMLVALLFLSLGMFVFMIFEPSQPTVQLKVTSTRGAPADNNNSDNNSTKLK